MIYMSYWNY